MVLWEVLAGPRNTRHFWLLSRDLSTLLLYYLGMATHCRHKDWMWTSVWWMEPKYLFLFCVFYLTTVWIESVNLLHFHFCCGFLTCASKIATKVLVMDSFSKKTERAIKTYQSVNVASFLECILVLLVRSIKYICIYFIFKNMFKHLFILCAEGYIPAAVHVQGAVCKLRWSGLAGGTFTGWAIFLYYAYILCVCLCVRVRACVRAVVCRVQKKELDPLELELQVVLSPHMVMENQTKLVLCSLSKHS